MMRIKSLFLLLLLMAQLSQAQYIMKMDGAEQPQEKPRPISGTPILNTPEFMAYLKSLGDDEFAKSLKKNSSDDIGTIKNFYVNNMETNKFESVEFKLMAKGTLSQIWCATEELNNGHLTQAVADTFLLYLENKSGKSSVNPNEGIIAIDQQYFGQPPDKDGDGLVDALLCDIKDGWEPGASGGYVAGFFYSMDQTNIPGKSNKADIIYLDSYPGIFYNGDVNPNGALQTIAHEYQHLIHFNYDRNEYTFINEGLSENAEYVTGLYTRSAYRYLKDVNIPIFQWNRSNALPDYSRTSLFFNYVGDRFGVENYKYFTQNPLAGPAGFNAALDSAGFSDVTIEDVIGDFHLANLINDRSVDERYGYINPARRYLEIPEQSAHKIFLESGNNGVMSVEQGGAVYLTFDHIDIQESKFTFPDNVKVTAVIYQQDGSVTLVPLLSGSNITLTGKNDQPMTYIHYVISNTTPSPNETTYSDQAAVSWEINGAKSYHYQSMATYNPVAKYYWAIPYYNSSNVGRFGFTNKYVIPEDGSLSQLRLFIASGIDGSTNDTIQVKGSGQLRIAVYTDNDGQPGTVMAEDTIDFSAINPSWNSFNVDDWNLNFKEGDAFHAVYEVMVPTVDNKVNSIPLRLDDGGGTQNVSKIITAPEQYADFFTDDQTGGEHGVWNEVVYKISGPEAPKDIKAEAFDSEARISWTKTLYRDFKMYRIYGGTSKNPTTVLDSLMSVDSTSALISGLQNGKKYYFCVTVVDINGKESEKSDVISAVPMSRAVADVELGVLQNPVFTEYIDVFLASNDELDPRSVAASLKQGNSSLAIGLVNKDGKNKVFQNTKLKLQAEGNIMIVARVKLPLSVSYAYDTLAFSTKRLYKKVDNIITSTDNLVTMAVRKNTIKEDFRMLLISPRKAEDESMKNREVLIDNEKFQLVSSPYFFSPAERDFKAEIQWHYNGEDARNIFIARKERDGYILIATRFNETDKKLYADVFRSGKYLLIKSVSGKENLSADIPTDFSLAQNYPNPFNPQTTIKFSLPSNQTVRLEIFNMLGQKIKTIVDADLTAGYHSYIWDGRNSLGESAATGIYFYRLQAGDSFVNIKKMTLIR